MSMSKEEHADLVKSQCKEQKRGDWAKKKTWFDKALALGFFKQDRKDIRAILEAAEAKGEYLPPIDNEASFGGLADEFERELLPSYFQTKTSEAEEGLNWVTRERPEAEEEIFSSECFLISTKKLFQTLIKQVGNESSWIEKKDLPLSLRFAIKRPLMSELQFGRALEILDLTLDFGREEAILAINNGSTGLARNKSEEDDARQFRENRQHLMNVYQLVQDGMLDSEEAHQHYREILGYTNVDNETLIASLQNYGIPIQQTPSSGRSLAQELPLDKGSRQIIEELSNLIKLYRSRHVTLAEVIQLIYERLDPYQPKRGVIKDYVKGSRGPDDAAQSLWNEAVEEDSEENNDDDDDDDDASDSDENSKPAHEGQSHSKTDLPASEALNGHYDKEDLESTNDASTVPDSLMGPPARLLRKPKSPMRDTKQRGQRQDTPILDATTLTAGGSESRSQIFSAPRTGQMSSVAMSSSRDPILYVQTGFHMPTKQARRLAYDLGLPYDYLRDRVRKRSIQGVRKQAKRTKLPVLRPKPKRKASDVVGQPRPRKSPRLKLFVKPRATKEDSGSSHRELRDMTKSRNPCPTCSYHPCRCSLKPQNLPEPDPRCPKCQQESCTCVESFRSPNRDKNADVDGGTSYSEHIDFSNIGQYSGSPYPVLAYLSRICEARDIFQLFIRVGFGNTTGAMRNSAYRVLAEIGLGIKLGEIKDCITKKDVAAVAVLQRLQGGSHQLREAALSSTKRSSSKSKSIKGAKATKNASNDEIPNLEHKALTPQQAKEMKRDANGDAKAGSSDIAHSDLAKSVQSSPFIVSNLLSGIAGSQMLIEIGKGILSGKLKSSIERDKTADAVLRHTQEDLHAVVERGERRDENSAAARNAGSARLPSTADGSLPDCPQAADAMIPSRNTDSDHRPAQTNSSPSDSHQDPILVINHLVSIPGDPFILPRLMKIIESVRFSRPEVEWMRTLLDSVPKVMRDGAIKGRWSKQDIAAISKMQKIVRDHSSKDLRHEKENTPPGGIDFHPVAPKFPKSNPVLAYLTRVLKYQNSEDSTLEFLRNLERNAMSKGTMGEVESIVRLLRQGMRTKEIDASRGQTWKDISACDILDRLHRKCKPLHAWKPYADIWLATEPASADSKGIGDLEGPKDSNSSSGTPTQDLSRCQHSFPASDIARGGECEKFDVDTEVESSEGSMKLTPSPSVSRSPTNAYIPPLGISVIPEARYPEPKGAGVSSTAPLTPQAKSYGTPRPPSFTAESSGQSPDSPLLPWTPPYELSTPRNSGAESGFKSPEPPPTPWPGPKELPSPINPVPGSSFHSPEPPPTPQPRPKELSRLMNPSAEPCLKSPEPPPAPRLKVKELPRLTIPPPKSFSQNPKRKNLPFKERPEQQQPSPMFKDMTAEECFEYFQDLAIREQRSFSSVMAERRAIRKRPSEADYRYFSSFFQSSNGGAPNLAATLSKLFDKYRGNVSMPQLSLNIVLNFFQTMRKKNQRRSVSRVR